MKKTLFLILLALTILSAQAASASCQSDFDFLQNQAKVSLKHDRIINLNSKTDFQNLRSPELKAVSNYVKFLNFKFDGENSLIVATAKYSAKDDNASLGYLITVTDGGDESAVDYYIKIAVGIEDVGYPILYRAWHNQTEARDFLCESAFN